MFRVLLCLSGLALFSACTSTPSDQIRTGGMYATVTANSWGDNGTTVSVRLNVGSSNSTTYVALLEPDRLEASVNGADAVPMAHYEAFSIHTYEAVFEEMLVDSRFNISLVRALGDDSAPSSTVSLPEAFELSGPSDLVLNSDLEISWTPAGLDDLMTLSVEGPCVQSYTVEIAGDPGNFVVPEGELKPFESADPMTDCTVNLELSRQRSAEVDPAFAGGKMVAKQRRLIDIKVTL